MRDFAEGGRSMVVCVVCHKEFEKNRHLRLHFARNHVDKSKWTSKCDICEKVYADEEILQRHMKNHEKTKIKMPCPVEDCSKSFYRKSFLDKHIATNHPETLPKNDPEISIEVNNNDISKKKYRCEELGCGASFGKHHLLTQHIYVHTNILPFQCDKCEKRFLTLNHKKRHEKVHNGYSCDQCEIVMSTWTSLLTHVARAHRKEYKCKQCDKVFRTPSRLQTHEVTHAEVRQVYQCKQCERNFTKKYAMTKHIKVVHEGIKKHTCYFAGCGKTYAHKKTLQMHITNLHSNHCANNGQQKKHRSDKTPTASRILGLDLKTFENAMGLAK